MRGLWPLPARRRNPGPITEPRDRRGRFPGALLLAWGLACGPGVLAAAGGTFAQEPAAADNPRLALPRSRLHRPLASPTFLAGQIGVGGGFSHANDQFGYGGQIIFHPGAAAAFLDGLYDWNTGLVLQGDYQEMYHSYRIRSGDLILRRYLKAAEVGAAGRVLLPFVGLGIGISQISFSLVEESVTETNWAPLAEVGWEVHLGGGPLLLCRGQYRHYDRHGHDYIDWGIRIGAGLPLP